MIKFCPTCNRSSEEARFIGEFCEFCVTDKVKANLPINVKLRRCRVCGAIRDSKGFVPYSNEAMSDAIAQQFHRSDCSIRLKEFDEMRKKALLHIVCETEDGKIRFNYEIGVKFTKEMCPSCYRKSAGYYEAILQLRGRENDVARFLDSFTHFITKGDAFISRTDEMGNGIDMYISDKKLVSEYFSLHKSIKPIVSYKLYGLKKGKKLYRHIYSVKL